MNDVINILMELGLNKYESAALAVLLTKGPSTPSDISKAAIYLVQECMIFWIL